MAGDLGAVHAKLDRAQFHAKSFDTAWQAFIKRGVYAYTVHMDVEAPQPIHFAWKVREFTAEDERAFTELSLIFGDLLSNLRATLDYLAWHLVLRAGNTPTDRTAFPCVKKKGNWASAKGDRLNGVAKQWSIEIEKLQPYHQSDRPERHLLAVLDLINNTNKHRTLPPTVVTLPNFSHEIAHPDLGGRTVSFDNWLDRPLEDGTEFYRLTISPPLLNLNLGVDADPPLRIAFRDGLDHSDGWGYSNHDLVQWIAGVVAIFEPAFES